MVARAVLDTLEACGVALSVEGGQLRTRAPKGAITPDLAALIREHKAELLALLTYTALLEGCPPGRPERAVDLTLFSADGHPFSVMRTPDELSTWPPTPEELRDWWQEVQDHYSAQLEARGGMVAARLSTYGPVRTLAQAPHGYESRREREDRERSAA